MKLKSHERIWRWFLIVLPFCCGCIVAQLGTPSSEERKVPAEFDLTSQKDKKILVLVNQPAWLGAQVNLRYYLTEAVDRSLTGSVGIDPSRLVGYSELLDFRSARSDFTMLPVGEIGRSLGADIVLEIMIDGLALNELAESGYYTGSLSAQAVLIDSHTGARLWPADSQGKRIRVGFEIEKGGREAAVRRLASSAAHCITRYFYDCKKKKFRLADDKSGIGWEKW